LIKKDICNKKECDNCTVRVIPDTSRSDKLGDAVTGTTKFFERHASGLFCRRIDAKNIKWLVRIMFSMEAQGLRDTRKFFKRRETHRSVEGNRFGVSEAAQSF
jgi:hypothetical protein